jgi:hypothetical protein
VEQSSAPRETLRFSLSHWVQGSPLPPAAQAIISLPLFALLAALSLSPPAHAQPCLPDFPYDVGWLGADGAFSIPLSPDRELWLFGDSFVARHNQHTRAGSTMVANTVAISSCRAGKFSIDYHWTPPTPGLKPRAFFDSRTHAFRYWPLDGFLYDQTLYVAMLRVETTNPTKPFGFKLIGVDLARIANPDAPPDRWSISYLSLSKSRAAFPGISIVVRPPYVYLYGVIDRDKHKRHAVILTRISLDHLDHPADSLEYLSDASRGRQPPKAQPTSEAEHQQDQKSLGAEPVLSLPKEVTPAPAWKPAPIQSDAADVVAQGQSDFSVRYHPEIAKWVMLQQQPGFATAEIGIRTADNLDGPWSPFRSLMNIPEMHTRQTDRKRIFCYAAKEHPSFESTPGTLVVTYACNSFSSLALTDMKIYHPIVIQLRMP